MKGKVNVKKLTEIISAVLIVLCIVGIVGFVAYFTNGFTGDFKTFYVNIDGENIMGEKSNVLMNPNEPMKVDVKYALGFTSKDIKGYKVKLAPISDFDFMVDGEVYSFAAVEDLEKGFTIVYEDEYFTITPKGNMQDVLQAIYPEQEVVVDPKVIPDEDLFSITVYDKDETASVVLNCAINVFTVIGITLDKEEIVF